MEYEVVEEASGTTAILNLTMTSRYFHLALRRAHTTQLASNGLFRVPPAICDTARPASLFFNKASPMLSVIFRRCNATSLSKSTPLKPISELLSAYPGWSSKPYSERRDIWFNEIARPSATPRKPSTDIRITNVSNKLSYHDVRKVLSKLGNLERLTKGESLEQTNGQSIERVFLSKLACLDILQGFQAKRKQRVPGISSPRRRATHLEKQGRVSLYM